MKDLSNTALLNLGTIAAYRKTFGVVMATTRQLHFCSIQVNSPASVSIMILVLPALKEILLANKCQKSQKSTGHPNTQFLHLQVACPDGISNTCAAKPPKNIILIIQRWSMARRSGDNAGIYWSMETHPASLPQLVEVFSGFPELRQPLHGHLAVFTWWPGCKILKIWFRWNKWCETSSNLAVLASWYQLPTWHT